MSFLRTVAAALLSSALAAAPAVASAEAYARNVAATFTTGCLGENPGKLAFCACALRETERSMPENDFVADSHANAKFEANGKLTEPDVQRIALLRQMLRSAAKSCAVSAR